MQQRLTAYSRQALEAAEIAFIVTGDDGLFYLTARVHGVRTRIFSGQGWMFYRTEALAVRAIRRINQNCLIVHGE